MFQGLDLRRTRFINCSLKDIDFSDAKLGHAEFTHSVLENSAFHGADLTDADLRYASRYLIDPKYTRLKGTKVDLPEAVSILTAIGLDIAVD